MILSSIFPYSAILPRHMIQRSTRTDTEAGVCYDTGLEAFAEEEMVGSANFHVSVSHLIISRKNILSLVEDHLGKCHTQYSGFSKLRYRRVWVFKIKCESGL